MIFLFSFMNQSKEHNIKRTRKSNNSSDYIRVLRFFKEKYLLITHLMKGLQPEDLDENKL